MKYKLAIFDMDGTILNTLDDLADSINAALESCGFPKRTLEEVRNFVGNGIRKLVERAVPQGTSQEEMEEVFQYFHGYYKDHCADKTIPYKGILELLQDLRDNKVLTAVVSNKADYAVQVLCRQYFGELFDYAVGEREGVRRKPFPDSVNEVLRKLKIDKADAVYIGDSQVDVKTAKNAEIDCIAVDWGFRDRQVLKEAGADRIVSHPGELYQHLA